MKFTILTFWFTLLLSVTLIQAFPISFSKFKKKRGRGIKSCYKRATLTQYWVPKEGSKDMLNNGKIVTLVGPKTRPLKNNSGKTIAKVSKTTYKKFQMEGTGLLSNGVMVNLDSNDNKFVKVNRKKHPYGLGDSDVSLVPWVSVASNDIKKGTKLYIKELHGVRLPNGKVHNGCVRVDDESWSFDGCQLDFFVLQFTAYQKLENRMPDKVTVTKRNCKIKSYITSSIENWARLK